jgi:catechol 2,3-dioxygenase-like lactoylglutathione lyase family enzyme
VKIVGIDHVQLAMPEGRERDAAGFYEGLLGITQVAKPEALAGRGGCWFESGALKVHLGVERDFRPARKAHPAFVVDDLDGLLRRLVSAGVRMQGDAGDPVVPGVNRQIYVEDPFGNRIELMEISSSARASERAPGGTADRSSVA